VLVAVALQPDVWPYATVSAVDDVAGAKVAGAWLLPNVTDSVLPAGRAGEYATGLDYLRAGLPGVELGAAELPQRLHDGKPALLIILWEITDCSRLRASERVRIEIRSVLGTTTRETLVELAAPGFDVATLASSGTCPRS
jgi:hypothetical protein